MLSTVVLCSGHTYIIHLKLSNCPCLLLSDKDGIIPGNLVLLSWQFAGSSLLGRDFTKPAWTLGHSMKYFGFKSLWRKDKNWYWLTLISRVWQLRNWWTQVLEDLGDVTPNLGGFSLLFIRPSIGMAIMKISAIQCLMKGRKAEGLVGFSHEETEYFKK